MRKRWCKATKKERIKILMETGMDRKEAHEVYWPTWNGLPDSVRPCVKR